MSGRDDDDGQWNLFGEDDEETEQTEEPSSLFNESPEAVARKGDPETSWAAAKSIPSERIRKSQTVILKFLRELGPMCDGEIWDLVQWNKDPEFSLSGARTRRKELVRLELVRDSGKRKLTKANNPTIVWEAMEVERG